MAITTNREYLATSLKRFGLSEDDIDLIMVENPSLSGFLNVQACKTAIYNSFSSILPVADVSDSGYSMTWDIEKIKLFYSKLCSELRKPNILKPAIRNKSDIW